MMGKRRILMVDDEMAFARLVKLNLEATGQYEVATEGMGSQAVQAARVFKPHLILLDVVMPDVDGGHVAEQLKEDPKLCDVPVIFLTAIVSRQETRGAPRMIGGHAFIAKPIEIKELIQRIEQFLPADASAAHE